jgi:DNA-binding HxlR family transcriptional regulator
MEDGKDIERDRQRAEIFDALGHPTRIVILKALSEGALGFADLKKKTDIESSGHLQHHLSKLNGLIKTDEYGKYCLSSEGKEALSTVQTAEKSSALPKNTLKHSPRLNRKMLLESASILLVALLIVSSAVTLLECNQIAGLHNENIFLSGANPEAAAYYNQFGALVPITNDNSSFAPPISMYHALLIGFTTEGWNKTSLQGTVVTANLVYWKTVVNITLVNSNPPVNTALNPGYQTNPSTALDPSTVISPPTDYSDVYSNGVIYQYVWQIDIQRSILMDQVYGVVPCQVLVDASTGQIVPNLVYNIG